MREKIRTPGLLIRSQTLYPAELRAHIGDAFAPTSYTITHLKEKIKYFFKKSKKIYINPSFMTTYENKIENKKIEYVNSRD